jgi:hypothetical protein
MKHGYRSTGKRIRDEGRKEAENDNSGNGYFDVSLDRKV